MPSINQWIRHVIMCKVQVLTLTIFKETDDEPWQKLDERPLISQHLRKLKLFHLWFNKSFIVLSSCPALEELEIDSCYLASVDGISSLSLKCLSIGCSCILGQTFRNQIYVPNLVSLQLDLDFDRVPVLEEMPSLEEAVVNIRDSEFDCCYRNNSGNCDYEGCDHCYEIEGDSESCVLLQGLSKAKKLTLKSDIKTVQLPIKSSFSCFSFLHFHHEYLLMFLPAQFIFRRDMKRCPVFSSLTILLLNEYWCVPTDLLTRILEHSPVLVKLTLQLFCTVYILYVCNRGFFELLYITNAP